MKVDNSRNIIIRGIIFLVALFPFDPGGGNWYYWSAFTVGASLILFLTFGLTRLGRIQAFQIPKYLIPLVLFSIFAFLSMFWSLSPYISMLYLGNYFAALVIGLSLIILQPRIDEIKKLINGVITVGVVYSVFGFIQFLTGGSGISIGQGFSRAKAFFVWPNTYAGFLNLILFPTLIFYFIKKQLLNRYLFFVLILYIGLMTTYSRGGFLAFVISFIVVATVTFAQKLVSKRKLGIAAAGFITVTLIFMNIPGAGFFDRAITLTNVDDPNQMSSGRLDIWNTAIEGWKLYPIKGAGIESFQFLSRQLDHRYEKDFWYNAHNDYLQILAELGIIGLALYLSIIVAVVLSIYQISKKIENKQIFLMYFGVFLGVLSFFIHEVVDYHLYIPGTVLLAFIYISIIVSAKPLPNLQLKIPSVILHNNSLSKLAISKSLKNLSISAFVLLVIFWLSQPALGQYFSSRAKSQMKTHQVVKALKNAEHAENMFRSNVFYRTQVADYYNAFAFVEEDSVIKRRLLNDAVIRYNFALKKERWNPALWTHFGNFALQHFDFFGKDSALSLAENSYKQATNCLPDYTRLYLQLAAIKLQQGDFYKADSNLQIYTKKHPDNSDGIELQAKLLFKYGKYNSLMDLLDSVNSRNDLSGMVYYYRGQVFQKRQDYKSAQKAYKTAINNNFAVPDCNYRLALIYINNGNFETALRYLAIADSLGYSSTVIDSTKNSYYKRG